MRPIELSLARVIRRWIVGLLVAVGLLAGTQALVAHHAGTMWSSEQTEISGTIKEFQFMNPHVWIQVMVETEPGAAAQEWSVEWGSPNSLGRRGAHGRVQLRRCHRPGSPGVFWR